MNDSPDASLKRCYSCKETFPATSQFFCKNKSKKDGLHDACKKCDSTRRKAYRESHREQECEHQKQYYYDHVDEMRARSKRYSETHREQKTEYWKQWVKSHEEQDREYHKQYHQEHLEEAHKQQKQYYQSRKEEACERQRLYGKTEQGRLVDKAHKHKRKAQKRASKGSYTPQQLQEQMRRQKSRCYYCKVQLGKIWHPDHVVPLSRGGSNDISNIVVACPTCNMHKAARLPHEWPEGNRLL